MSDYVVVVKRPYTTVSPVKLTLKTDSAFDGTGRVTRNVDIIDFSLTAGGPVLKFDGTDNQFPGAKLTAGVDLFATATKPSTSMNDVVLTLTLTGGSKKPGPPATTKLTAVLLTLDICKSRTSPTTDPDPLSDADKNGAGRFLHRQFGIFHGRAMLIVRKKPDDFTGTLTLKPITPAGAPVQLFDSKSEVPAGADTALKNPHEFPAASVDKTNGLKFFAEGGSAPSKALRDTGYQLGVKGVADDGDHVAITVVQFKKIKADIPSTPANQIRKRSNGGASNSPVPRHTLLLANPPAAASYDEDYTNNDPLVLIEDSVLAADPIKMSVEIEPAGLGIPIRWSAQRDRSATGDHKDISALKGNDSLTLDPVAGTLLLDNVGSFHIRPYIDCNGDNTYDYNTDKGARIDREPFVIMNLVIIRVQSLVNNSRGNPAAFDPAKAAHAGVNYVGGKPTNLSTGDGKGTGNDACTMDVTARVIGGGGDGKRGLDRLFASWCNNELDCPTSPGPGGHGEDVTHHFQRPVAVGAPPPPPPLLRTRCLWKLDGAEIQGPMLDSGYEPNEGIGGNTCTGTMGANGNWPPASKPADPSGVGERWQVINGDPPGSTILQTAPSDAAATLRRFTFNLDWRCALLFWTNRNKVVGADDFPACRLYVSVQTNTWRVRLESTFDDAFAETKVTPINAVCDKDGDPTRKATPVAGTNIETREPDGVGQLNTNVAF
jgi:hypothetical protein